MTQKEIITQRASNDIDFAINFLLANNYPAVAAALAGKGYSVSSPEQAFGIIKNGNKELVRAAFSVPYNNGANNGTGGLAPANSAGKFSLSFLDTIIPGAGTLLNDTLGLNESDSGSAPKSQSSDIALLLASQQAAQEAADKRSRDNQTTMLYVGGFLILLIIGAVVTVSIVNSKKIKA